MYNFSSEFFNNNTIHDNKNMSVDKIEENVNRFQETNTTVKGIHLRCDDRDAATQT
jgi:hypothetical protein